MRTTLKLTYIYFKEQLLNLLGGTSKKASRKSLPAILALFLFVAAALGYSLYTIAETLAMLSLAQNILIIGLLMGMFMSLLITLNDTQGTMYKSKDYDMLMSLPLSSVSIISAKYLSTYFVSMVYFAMVALPTFVVYFIFQPVTVLSVVFAILAIILVPAFSQMISCILGWFVSSVSSKMRNKNLMRTIFSLIMAVGISVFIAFANSNVFSKLFQFGMPLWFKIVFSHIYFLFMAMTKSSILYFLALLGVSVAFLIAGILIISVGYKSINTLLLATKTSKKLKPITYKNRSIFANLFHKETTTFFNSPLYCVNGLIGVIMTVVITVITLTIFGQIKQFGEAVMIMTPIEIFGMAMCTGIAPTTSVSISIEGTKFQTLKSLPIRFRDIVLSKVTFNLVLALPVVLVCSIVFACIIHTGWVLAILMLIYLILSVVSQTVLGLLLNLRYPRLHWTSETQAVKAGASMMLTMFLDMVVALVPMALFFLVMTHTSLTVTAYLGIVIAIVGLLTFTLILLLAKLGPKLFKNIQV